MVVPRKAAAFSALSLLAVCALVVVHHQSAGRVALESFSAMDKYQVGHGPFCFRSLGLGVGAVRCAPQGCLVNH